uniref:Nuclear receptor domain-containing protein n=1 Tax=Elaeophora elaphi TaxID=1147741 RepID=A0A0R3RLB7_9BILA
MSRPSLNEQERSSSSFRIPDSNSIDSTANRTTHIGFTPISNSVPPVFNTLNNPFIFISDTNNRLPNSDNRNLLFPTDRFNSSFLQTNISPYASIINNDHRLHSASTIFSNPLGQYNSMGISTNGTTFDRFLQPFSVPQGTTTMSPSSVPVISVPSVAQTIPTAGHTSLFPMAANNNGELSAPSSIPPSFVSEQPYRYLLSFEQQSKLAHEAAMHYANLTKHLMEHARNAAAAENMPPPPLPQAVVSMVQKYDPPKDSLQHLQQQQKEKEEKKDRYSTYPALRNLAPFPLPDTVPSCDSSDQQQMPSELLGQKRPATSSFSEPMMKVRNVDIAPSTDATP